MAGKGRQNPSALKIAKRGVKARTANRTTARTSEGAGNDAASAPNAIAPEVLAPNGVARQAAAVSNTEHPALGGDAADDPVPIGVDMGEAPRARTPYQRMQELLAARDRERQNGPRVVSTVEDLQEYLNTKGQTARIIIRMKLLWISDHVFSNWKMVRLHFVDAESPESIEDMLSVFKDPYESNREDIDTLLVTVTIWNMESDSKLLPPPGAVVDISEYTNLQLYREKQCQLTARLTHMTWET